MAHYFRRKLTRVFGLLLNWTLKSWTSSFSGFLVEGKFVVTFSWKKQLATFPCLKDFWILLFMICLCHLHIFIKNIIYCRVIHLKPLTWNRCYTSVKIWCNLIGLSKDYWQICSSFHMLASQNWLIKIVTLFGWQKSYLERI